MILVAASDTAGKSCDPGVVRDKVAFLHSLLRMTDLLRRRLAIASCRPAGFALPCSGSWSRPRGSQCLAVLAAIYPQYVSDIHAVVEEAGRSTGVAPRKW